VVGLLSYQYLAIAVSSLRNQCGRRHREFDPQRQVEWEDSDVNGRDKVLVRRQLQSGQVFMHSNVPSGSDANSAK